MHAKTVFQISKMESKRFLKNSELYHVCWEYTNFSLVSHHPIFAVQLLFQTYLQVLTLSDTFHDLESLNNPDIFLNHFYISTHLSDFQHTQQIHEPTGVHFNQNFNAVRCDINLCAQYSGTCGTQTVTTLWIWCDFQILLVQCENVDYYGLSQ